MDNRLVLPERCLISIGGVARCGKNLFTTLSREYLSSRGYTTAEFAFATQLKLDIEPFLQEKYGISAFTQDTEEKKVIRPHLVALGKKRRDESNGRYWIEQLVPQINKAWAYYDVIMISDVRYSTHETDEVAWVKSLGGKVIYIERILETGELLGPANEEEAANDSEVRAGADLVVSWPTFLDKDGQKNLDNLRAICETTWDLI